MPSSHSQNALSMSVSEDTVARVSAFKTPAKSLKRGRAVHDENAIYGHPRTAGLTGRKGLNTTFSTPAIGKSSHDQLKLDKVPRTANKSTALSEITNKTPFPKSLLPVTPLPPSLKPLKSLTVFNDNSAVLSARRISSTRKKLRLPNSTSKNYETPETRGDHWDVSDVSIEASVIDEASETGEDLDDVEYGPPTAIDPKYEPPFDMPDYKEVGATLMSLFRRDNILEDYDPATEFDNTELLAEIGTLEWERLEFPEIPLENIFPSMLQSKPPLSVKTEDRHARIVRQNTVRSAANPLVPRQVIPLSKFKSSTTVHATPSTQGHTTHTHRLPGSAPSKPMRTHTRIPSLSKGPAQVSSGVNQTMNSTGSHARSMSVSHRVTLSKAASTSHSRTSSLPKPLSTCHKTPKDRLQTSEVKKDPVESLSGMGDVLEEDFLFDV